MTQQLQVRPFTKMMWLYVGRDGRNLDMESLDTLWDKQPALRKVANKKKWGRFITERHGILVDFFKKDKP